jgi:hypothetical protein
VRVFQNELFTAGTTITLGQAGAPLVIYEEGTGPSYQKWLATGGTVTIDTVTNFYYPTLRIAGATMSPPGGTEANPGTAAGTFTLDASVTKP